MDEHHTLDNESCDTKMDVIMNVGHSDLYFTVQSFCLKCIHR